MSSPRRSIAALAVSSAAGCLLALAMTTMAAAEPVLVRDLIWVWGNPEMAEPGTHTPETYAAASPAERARLLGVSNIILAGLGLPQDDAKAEAIAQDAANAPRLLWEIARDGEGEDRPFVYEQTLARLRRLADRHSRIEGVLLDDMSSVGIDHGLKPEHIQGIRAALSGSYARIKLWGVLYTMNMDRPGIADYIRALDGIILAEWHAKNLPDLEKQVLRCRKEYPDKPILLCLYLYDYGENRRMPLDLLEGQCRTALKLAHSGDIVGMVPLTITNDVETVSWFAKWVNAVGGQTVGHPPSGTPETTLHIGDAAAWHFPAGPWTEDGEGVIRPPDRRNLHSRAFFTAQAFGDFMADFEFNGNYRETGTGSAGLVFRAMDANHFYFLYFPWGGQQLRAKHFWAVLAKVDGDGYLRNLAAEWVPGLASETDRWYKVRIEAAGPEMQVWVDGHRALHVTDAAYKSGCMGLAGYGWYSFRNVRIAGARVAAPAWDMQAAVPSHRFSVGLTSEQMPSACIAPNGDVLLAAGSQLVRSKDKRRTWAAPEALPEGLGVVTDYGNTLFRTAGGRLIVMLYRPQEKTGKSAPEISIAESTDNGLTWSAPVPSEVGAEWPAQRKNVVPYGPLIENKDGVLMRFLLGGVKEENDTFTDVRTWGSIHCKAFVIRSMDGGKTWSGPIEIDRPSWSGTQRGTIPGSLDLTEPTGVVIGNIVTVLVRPVYSPMMWQCWSYDGGATWDAAARATFPGYAQSMTRTSSGAILCAHRFPLYSVNDSVNVSRDNGLNWDAGTVIDYPAWAMGCTLEVEPDVVLAAYMNAERNLPLLLQRIRVTPQGLRPEP
ncbi:MAG: exo-alpha-sialidase [Candidatus Hydrogenedentes bacterium]|nr:exo-alpha-sialidase [Candidatus Hydrogenedentota bacterium]